MDQLESRGKERLDESQSKIERRKAQREGDKEELLEEEEMCNISSPSASVYLLTFFNVIKQKPVHLF